MTRRPRWILTFSKWIRGTGMTAPEIGKGEVRALHLDDYLTKPIPSEKEFHRLEAAEQFLQAAVIEELYRLAGALRGHVEHVHFLYAESVGGHRFQLVVGMKECQHVALGTDDFAEPIHDRSQQGRFQVFEHIPNEHAIEVSFGIFEGLAQEIINAAGIGLIGRAFYAKSFGKNLEEIFGINPVSEVRYETDILLGCAAQVEEGQSGLAADIGKELFQPAALAGAGLRRRLTADRHGRLRA